MKVNKVRKYSIRTEVHSTNSNPIRIRESIGPRRKITRTENNPNTRYDVNLKLAKPIKNYQTRKRLQILDTMLIRLKKNVRIEKEFKYQIRC